MKFTTSGLLAIAAAFPSVLAVEFTNTDFDVVAGKAFTLSWADASGDVTITLKDGASTDLKTVSVLASGLTGTSYTWTPSASLTSDTYAFEIEDDTGVPNYSSQFEFVGSASATSAVASSTAAASTAKAASSAVSSAASSVVSSAAASSLAISSSATAASSSAVVTSSQTTIVGGSSGNSTRTATSLKTSTGKPYTSSPTGSASNSTTTTPVSTNDGKMLGSPLALVLGSLISLFVFN
ncbi:hypothetical protein VPNG_00311 [Cytospora leucostoma]|uniref:Yeast cell wall synthesis Kre9/Knh1-like N-terminal domain-containing protein n=1 Tax=Cytospora leucostoma TaxID=1230097 RepID=A0A423XNG6_9PEZI|nr:hypothetical protein VPNG_00311 [Cytospora leucostoma]